MTSSCKEKQKAVTPVAPNSHITYRPDIDGLRAIAVLLVIGFHAFPKYIRGGFIGVDIFFVISGFLITSLILQDLDKQQFSFADFYSRRIRRIFPALFTVLTAVLAFGWFALLPDEYQQLGKHVAGGAGFISNLILWKESGYFDVASELKPLLHLWSLGIEEQYYILWPLFLYLLSKKRLNLLTGTTLLLLLSFGINLALYKKNLVADFYFPGSRFWELLAGATLAYLTLHPLQSTWIIAFREKRDKLLYHLIYAGQDQEKQKKLWSNLLSILGILLIAFAAYKLTKGHPFPGKWAILPVLGAVFLIAAGPSAWVNKNILSKRLLVWIGLISYPLYLWHWPLLSFARIIGGKTPSAIIRTGLVVLAFILSWLTYRLVEKPLRFGQYGKAKAIGLVFVVAIVGLAGLYVKNTRGLPKRAHITAYEKVTKQLLGFPSKNEDAVEYIGREKAELPDFYRYSGTRFTQTVAVVGDSHAHAAYSGIANLGREMGFNTIILGHAGNEIMPLFRMGKDLAFIDVLLEKPDVKLVFLIFRIRLYISGEHNFAGTSPDEIERARKNRVSSKILHVKLQEIVDKLKAAGKEVIIVGDNPELPDSVRDYVKRPLNGKDWHDFPVLLKQDVLAYQKEALALLHEMKGVEVVSPVDVFCPLDKCHVFDEAGLPLYYDDDHLSEAGSEFQARQLFLPYLKKMMEQEKTGAIGGK